MRCLSAAFIFLALAARRVTSLDITISGTQDGEPVPPSELKFSKWEEGTLGVPVRAPEPFGKIKATVAAAANPTAGSINCAVFRHPKRPGGISNRDYRVRLNQQVNTIKSRQDYHGRVAAP